MVNANNYKEDVQLKKGLFMSKWFLVLFTAILTNTAHTQWVQTNGPYEGYVDCFGVSPNGAGGTNIFAGTQGAGVFLSTNKGTNWVGVNSGLPSPTDVVTSFAVSGVNVFAGTLGGVFRTTNNGTSWTTATGGLTPLGVNALAIQGANLFAGTQGSIYQSTNNGSTWTAASSGLPSGSYIFALAVISTNIFAATDGNGVFLSSNNGGSWHRVNTGLSDTSMRALAVDGTNLLAGTLGGGVFVSTNNGTSWTSSGLPFTTVEAFVVSDSNIFAGTFFSGLFHSTDHGMNWSPVNTGLPPYSQSTNIGALAAIPDGVGGTDVFAGTFGNGVFLSIDNGASWAPTNTGLMNTDINGLMVDSTTLFTGTNFGSDIFRSTDNGASWTVTDSGLTQPISSAEAFAAIPDGAGGKNTFAGTSNGVFLSTNNGNNWIEANSGLPALLYRTVSSLAVVGTNLFAAIGAGTSTNGVYLSTDNGTSWNHTNISLTTSSVNVLMASPNGIGGTNLFVGTLGAGVYVTTNNGAVWTPADSGMKNAQIKCLTTTPDGVGGVVLFAGSSGGVYRSTNNGSYWTLVDSGLGNTDINSLASYGTSIFAGTSSGIYQSTNNGNYWSPINTGLPKDPLALFYPIIKALAVDGSDLIAGTFLLGVWRRPLSQITSVDRSPGGIPKEMTLEQNYPNPFNPSTIIRFELPSTSRITLRVYNLLGQVVATLIDREEPAGSHDAEWHASRFASGIYFYRLEATGLSNPRQTFSQVKKMELIK